MINFFRKIRKKLANENKFQKYTRYAIGEILLIVIGIFLAVQLQNWNEKRKLDLQYKVTLEQLYNSINYDIYLFKNDLELLGWQTELIDNSLLYPDSFPLQILPWSIFVLSYEPSEGISPETVYYSSFLKNNASNSKQNQLSKHITKFANYRAPSNTKSMDLIYPVFLENEIPIPNPTQSLETNFYKFDDTLSFYSNDELNRLGEIFHSHKFKSTIKTMRSLKITARIQPTNLMEDAISLQKLIKNYYPEVQLIYEDVGIIGTSINGFPDEGAKSTPMNKTNHEENIWEIEMRLKKGKVKFRCRDSWAQNWGGDNFPNGTTDFDGEDILVDQEGVYKIILNLSKNTYKFIKKVD